MDDALDVITSLRHPEYKEKDMRALSNPKTVASHHPTKYFLQMSFIKRGLYADLNAPKTSLNL